MKYFLHIAYDGSKYRGWQRQPESRSVQETIERLLAKMFKTDITVYGCGRTDAGVHASQYFMHFSVDQPVAYDLKFSLNRCLPDDIAVFDVIEMPADRHARFDVSWRTYDYFIHSYKDPVIDRYSSYYDLSSIDFAAMEKAVALISSNSDFAAVCKHPHLHNHTVCQIKDSSLYYNSHEQRMCFSITADRFLKQMIRLLVAYILRAGNGELSVPEFGDILKSGIPLPAFKPAKPNGLFLSKVEYPYLSIAPKQGICSFLKQGLANGK